ncbi:MAG: glycosyltransferase family 4 protein, partial [Cyanobacteria bacterium K_DeepCast_35m_m2_023]|nr:glycosyltransferase family 4 protein [Cyanobacteria bacterium K_DeepCast_35m_m2_023]
YPTVHRILARIKPDVVHVDEESFNLATFLAMVAAHRVGAKTCFYNYANIERRYPPPFSWFERYAFTHASHAMACSHEAADIIRNHGYPGPISIIPQTGVDETHFVPRPDAHIARTPFTIGYVGRLVPEKGIDDAISALAQLPTHVRMHIVGAGQYESALRQHATTLGVDARIIWQKPVSSHEMPGVMQQFDALVLPSRTTSNWKEQFGRVLIEAMACGVPVIGSSSGEIPHVIGDGGLVFPEGDVNHLTLRLLNLINNPTLYAQLSGQSRQRIFTKYTQISVAQQYWQIYAQINNLR